MSHTPGPWELAGPHQKGDKIGSPRTWRYVQHHFPDHPYEGELSDEYGIYPPLGEAGPVALVAGKENATLISVAPEMLEMLKKHLSDSGCDGDLCNRSWHEEFLRLIRTVEPNWSIR